jgi:hypothetical protein
MVKVQQHILILILGAPLTIAAQKFFPDDPLTREPKPRPANEIGKRDINEYYDFFQDLFFEPGKDIRKAGQPDPSAAVNSLGEVPDSAWFTNRIGSRPMSVDELKRGPGVASAPSKDGPWVVSSGKNEGVTPGLVFRDSKGRRYFLKFDPKDNPEMAGAADVVGAKFFYDLGYNTPENYPVTFTRSQLVLNEKSKFRDPRGKERPMRDRDIDDVLAKVPRDREGKYIGMASLSIPGNLIGPFRYYNTRSDDPNDIVAHETRRDLRGLYVFAAWLNHTDAKSINSMDSVVVEDGVSFVRHYLLDFGAILGSASFEPKSPRMGNVYFFDFKPAAYQFLSLGLIVPGWMHADFPDIRSVGSFESKYFDPERWRNNYPNPAFDQRTLGDCYWAAKKLMAFSDEAIRAIVETAEYDDPRATDWVTKCLIERRDKIGRVYFERVLPLDNFAVRGGKLVFDDLAARYGFKAARECSAHWFEFDNQTGTRTAISGSSFDLPHAPAQYIGAAIWADDPAKAVTVYLRGEQVVGIERANDRMAARL